MKISRTVNPLQEMVLNAIGVDEIISPEEETAARWSKKLNLGGVVDSFEVNQDYSIVEVLIPEEYHGKTLEEVGLRRKYNITVLTTLKVSRKKNKIDVEKNIMEVQEVASAKTVLKQDDVLVLYGPNKDIKKLLKDHTNYEELS